MKNEVPIRIFPLQKDGNEDKDWISMGMLAIKNHPNNIKVNIRDVKQYPLMLPKKIFKLLSPLSLLRNKTCHAF